MQNATIIEFARQLLEVHERICVKYGAKRTAETWRNVQTALKDMRH